MKTKQMFYKNTQRFCCGAPVCTLLTQAGRVTSYLVEAPIICSRKRKIWMMST